MNDFDINKNLTECSPHMNDRVDMIRFDLKTNPNADEVIMQTLKNIDNFDFPQRRYSKTKTICTYHPVIQMLYAIRMNDLKINILYEHIARLQRIDTYVANAAPSKHRSGAEDKLANAMDQFMEIIYTITDLETDANKKLASVLPPNEYVVMIHYFFFGRSWEQIANYTFWSDRQIYNYRKSAFAFLIDDYESSGATSVEEWLRST